MLYQAFVTFWQQILTATVLLLAPYFLIKIVLDLLLKGNR